MITTNLSTRLLAYIHTLFDQFMQFSHSQCLVSFRSASFGYFGHMWELYAFWTFVPLILSNYIAQTQMIDFNISLMAFTIIAIGGIGSFLGGMLSEKVGSYHVAFYSLLIFMRLTLQWSFWLVC